MNEGALWALVAAVGFGFVQVSSRKVNQEIDAYRAAFGLLFIVSLVLIVRGAVVGELGLIPTAPLAAVGMFTAAAFFHFTVGWTVLGLSQQRIGAARTGALVGAYPLVGSLLARVVLDEPLTPLILGGVLLATAGVALISLSSGADESRAWVSPWLALVVAVIWGSTPVVIRLGLERFDHPVLGLTIGLTLSVILYAVILTVAGGWKRGPVNVKATRWMAIGGCAGAIALSAQWLAFGRTTIAVAVTVQQLSVLVVVGLVASLFDEPVERMNARFAAGTVAMMAGAVLVVLG